MNNFRLGGYLLIAVGLINLRYNTGQPNNLQQAAFIIVPGLALIGATFIEATRKLIITPSGKVVAFIVVIAGVLYAGISN